jgi:adenylosuccinate synthase
MRRIVLISGRSYSGKSGLGHRLSEEYNYHLVRTSDLVGIEADNRRIPRSRSNLQKLGDELDRETDHAWVHDQVLAKISSLPESVPVVVDCVRTEGQLRKFRNDRSAEIVHVHLYAPATELLERFNKKNPRGNPNTALRRYRAADLMKTHADIVFFKRDADLRINTGRTDGRDTLVRVAAKLGLLPQPDVRCVDVVVGGQYGSEGKGHIAAYLSPDYDVLVRVGGPNAGHTVSSRSGVYTYHQLPSGSKDTNAKILLGPGMTINVRKLLKEIKECGVTSDRLFIDPQAMIIEAEDIRSERGEIVGTIGSTGQGGGFAAARRIKRSGKIRLARDIPSLKPYVGVGPRYRGSTVAQLEKAYRLGESILLEGTQGSGLSLLHGEYPHVTSRDTNVAGCLMEAGISPARVRKVLMVVRSTPIRVADPDGDGTHTSGYMKREIDFETVAKQARLDPREVLKYEKTSTTKRKRRVAWFDWEKFHLACQLNAPTDIVLTFADYIDAQNRDARRFEQLTDDTIKFIEELENVSHAHVSLVNTRFSRESESVFDVRSIIDRRAWVAKRRNAS